MCFLNFFNPYFYYIKNIITPFYLYLLVFSCVSAMSSWVQWGLVLRMWQIATRFDLISRYHVNWRKIRNVINYICQLNRKPQRYYHWSKIQLFIYSISIRICRASLRDHFVSAVINTFSLGWQEEDDKFQPETKLETKSIHCSFDFLH